MILSSKSKRRSSHTLENNEHQTSSLADRVTSLENDSKEQSDFFQESSDRHTLNQLVPSLAFEGSLGCKKFKFLQDLPTSLPEASQSRAITRKPKATVSIFGLRPQEANPSPFDLASDKNIRVKSESNHRTATFGYAYVNTELFENVETPASINLEKLSPSKESASFGGFSQDRKAQLAANQADASIRAIAPQLLCLDRTPSTLLIGAVQRSRQGS